MNSKPAIFTRLSRLYQRIVGIFASKKPTVYKSEYDRVKDELIGFLPTLEKYIAYTIEIDFRQIKEMLTSENSKAVRYSEQNFLAIADDYQKAIHCLKAGDLINADIHFDSVYKICDAIVVANSAALSAEIATIEAEIEQLLKQSCKHSKKFPHEP
jgi:hypothetical protein